MSMYRCFISQPCLYLRHLVFNIYRVVPHTALGVTCEVTDRISIAPVVDYPKTVSLEHGSVLRDDVGQLCRWPAAPIAYPSFPGETYFRLLILVLLFLRQKLLPPRRHTRQAMLLKYRLRRLSV